MQPWLSGTAEVLHCCFHCFQPFSAMPSSGSFRSPGAVSHGPRHLLLRRQWLDAGKIDQLGLNFWEHMEATVIHGPFFPDGRLFCRVGSVACWILEDAPPSYGLHIVAPTHHLYNSNLKRGEGLSPWSRPVELGQLGWASVVVPSKLFACHWGKGNVWPAVQWRFKTYRLVRWHLGRKRIAFHWRLRHVKTLWIFKTPKLRRVRNRARSHSPSVSADTCETRQDINFTFRVSDGFSMCQSSDLINGVFICFHVLSSPDKVFAICATARLTWLCRRMLREVHEM